MDQDSSLPAGGFTQNIILIGPMGVGKTTIGRLLAKTLKLEFRDSDREIERRTGVDIPLIFELEGEAGFRRREKAMICELSASSGLVLATGGGAVMDPENRRVLADSGTVIYLRADVPHLVERTSRDTRRPLLQTADPEKRIRELLEMRDPMYREIADMVVDTGGKMVKSVVAEIMGKLNALRQAQ